MIDFDALEFDESYVPDREVLDAANSFLLSVVTPMYIDGHAELTARVKSIKKVVDTAMGKKSSSTVNDILLYLQCEAWSYPHHFWKDETNKKHTLDTLYCTVQQVVIRRSILLKHEIEDQFGIADWEEADVGGFEAKTDSGNIPDDALQTYFELLQSDWEDLVTEFFEAGCPSLKTLDLRVTERAIKALRKEGEDVGQFLEF